ncbi:MAG: hypothetical protein CMJ18_08320 [Phycisphaeraceae bacterium]|nr:hypothetical protein [Phycisphaeraceae bacterium]
MIVITAPALFAVACHSAPQVADDGATVEIVIDVEAAAAVPTPEGLDAGQVAPRTGQALIDARLTLPEIRSRIERPAYLAPPVPEAAADPATEPEEDREPEQPEQPESPLAAQRLYVAGRQAFRDGRHYDAVWKLKAAHELAPQSGATARLLGRIFFQSKRAQSRSLLETAARHDPSDVQSVYLLARLHVDRSEWPEVIALLDHVLQLEKSRPAADLAIWTLARFHLAEALAAAGHDQAAIDHYRAYLDTPRRVVQSMHFAREVYRLGGLHGSVWRRIGDAHLRLNEPRAALEAYNESAIAGVSDRPALVRRIVYCCVRQRRVNDAVSIVVAELSREGAIDSAIGLVSYLADHAPNLDRDGLEAKLRTVYRESDHAADVALAIAGVLERKPAIDMLREHLAARPADSAVFVAMLKLQLASEAGEREADAEAALRRSAEVIRAVPAAAGRYSGLLLGQAETGALLAGFDRMSAEDREEPVMRYLRGRVLARAGRPRDALREFEAARQANSELRAASIAAATILLDTGRYDDARRMLEGLGDDEATTRDPEFDMLRIRLLTHLGDHEAAVRLLDKLIRRRPKDITLVLKKAEVLLATGDLVQAESTLQKSLGTHQRDERLYEALFEIYERRTGIEDWRRRHDQLVETLMDRLPESWLARYKTAQWLVHQDEPDRIAHAEHVLRELMDERPADPRPVRLTLAFLVRHQRNDEADALAGRKLEADAAAVDMLEVVVNHMWLTDQEQAATRLVEAWIAQRPRDPKLLEMAIVHFQIRVRDADRATELWTMLLETQAPTEARALALARSYLRLDRPQDALDALLPWFKADPSDPVLILHMMRRAYGALERWEEAERAFAEAIERFKEHGADLMLDLAMMQDQRELTDRAEQVMVAALARYPEHPDLNNSLGYAWANKGRHLERATDMIRKAVDAEPTNAAFRDSLGWVYYKRGRFAEAVRELKRARGEKFGSNPIILDHLGDAQFRLGRADEATQSWRHALQQMEEHEDSTDREMKGLDERIRRKLKAHRLKQKPPIADVAPDAGDPARGAAAPAKAEKPAAARRGARATRPYIVQTGDTLEKIARRLYGSPLSWVHIALVNPSVVWGELHEGQVLEVPVEVPGPAIEAP